MTTFLDTLPPLFDMSITLSIYDDRQQVTRRTFPLRNLQGETEEAQVSEAIVIMNDVAAELHHITGFGIDKGVVKVKAKKAAEVVYTDYRPGEGAGYFRYGINIKFTSRFRYRWVDGRQRTPRLTIDKLNEERQLKIVEENKSVSFRLPCLALNSPGKTFFRYMGEAKRGRRVIGWICHYDRQDMLFNRFLNRFYEGGHLTIGEKKVWSKSSSLRPVDGVFWPPPKILIEKAPRKSRLASLPADDTEYVYLIRMGRTPLYKIGKSNDPNGRLASMQTASPYKLKLLHAFKADNATAAEEALHAQLHGAKKEGEWFKLTDAQREAILAVTAYQARHFITAGEERTAAELFQD